MPVISSKALAIVLDSYSWVVMVSDTTEISFTPLACSFLAASMNHFISAICWSLDKVDGWNSLSTHFLAAASSAQAWPAHGQCGGDRQRGVFELHVFSLVVDLVVDMKTSRGA